MKPTKQFQLHLFLLLTVTFAVVSQQADAQQRRRMMRPFKTDTAMVHDPVMAYENGTYYVFSTGRGLQMMTSDDRSTWNVWPAGVMREVPE
jgi:arabinan endo-1,5-alpha-L-arabinosidase